MSDLVRRESRFIAPAGGATRQVGPPTVAAAVPLFLETVASGRSPRTALTYRTGLVHFREYLQVVGIDPDECLTTELPPAIPEEYTVALGRAFQIKATAASYTAGLKAFMRWLYRRRWGPLDSSYEEIALAIKEVTPRFSYRSRQPDSQLAAVVQQLLSEPAPGRGHGGPGGAVGTLARLRDRALFVLLATSGLRVAEVVSLDRSILTDELPVVIGKGDKERAVFLSDVARAAISAYLVARQDDSRALFCSHHRSGGQGEKRRGAARPDNRLSPQGAWLVVRRHGDAFGVHITPHHFRHQFARDLRKAGVNMADISEILGHSSTHVTHKIYARIDVAHLQRAYDQYAEGLPKGLPAD